MSSNVDQTIAQLQQMSQDYQKLMKASQEIQMQLGMAQTEAQTAQQAVGGAKAASRPA
jgi:chaperonin cofactor prefoldin